MRKLDLAAYFGPHHRFRWKPLVPTDGVADHPHDPDVRLLEVDVDTTAYERGHIAGAVGLNWTTQLGDRIRRDIPGRAAWPQLMGESGVDKQSRLIVYGDNNNWFAAFACRKKWELEQRPVTTEPPTLRPATYPANEPDFSLRAYLKDVLDRPSATTLVDVRSPAEFNGEIIAPPGLTVRNYDGSWTEYGSAIGVPIDNPSAV